MPQQLNVNLYRSPIALLDDIYEVRLESATAKPTSLRVPHHKHRSPAHARCPIPEAPEREKSQEYSVNNLRNCNIK